MKTFLINVLDIAGNYEDFFSKPYNLIVFELKLSNLITGGEERRGKSDVNSGHYLLPATP